MSNENQLSADIGGLQKLDYTIVYHFKYIVIILEVVCLLRRCVFACRGNP